MARRTSEKRGSPTDEDRLRRAEKLREFDEKANKRHITDVAFAEIVGATGLKVAGAKRAALQRGLEEAAIAYRLGQHLEVKRPAARFARDLRSLASTADELRSRFVEDPDVVAQIGDIADAQAESMGGFPDFAPNPIVAPKKRGPGEVQTGTNWRG